MDVGPVAPALSRIPREAQLAYAREHLPDLSIRHELASDGPVSKASFTFRGREKQVSCHGEGCEDEIVREIVEFIRTAFGARVESDVTKSRDLEEAIVRARYAGQDAEADMLTKELVASNADQPAAWNPRTGFGGGRTL